MKVSESKMIDVVMYAYGFSKKEAKKFLKNITEERKELLWREFSENAKRAFYQD